MNAHDRIPPTNVIFVKDGPPPNNPAALDAFESEFKAQRGFVDIRYSNVKIYYFFLIFIFLFISFFHSLIRILLQIMCMLNLKK
jgi:hypothetical protein